MRALIVEDEMTIALLIEDMVSDMGHEVVGLAMRLPQALQLARTLDLDFAILDVNLDGRVSFPVADALAARNIPFVFVTGYGDAGVDSAYRRRRVGIVKKPFETSDLRHAIDALSAGGG